MKVAVVGFGWWAKPIGNGARRSDYLEIISCYTRNEENRLAYAREYNCNPAESYEAILADSSVESVLLTTPNTAHAGQIEAAMVAEKHVWVEKPVTNALAEVPGVLASWRAAGLTLAVGHCYRRAAGHRMIGDGTLGRPLWAEAAFTNPAVRISRLTVGATSRVNARADRSCRWVSITAIRSIIFWGSLRVLWACTSI